MIDAAPEEVAGVPGRRLDVLHVAACPYPSPQGTQVYLRGLLSAQRRRGHRVRLLSYGFGDGGPTGGVEQLGGPTAPLYRRLRAGPDPVRPFLDLALAPALRRLAPDVVHLHNYEAPAVDLLVRRWAGGGAGIPRVYTAHNLMEEELPTYARTPLVAGVARAAGRALDRWIPAQADAVVALNPRTVPPLRALGCTAVHVIPPGFDFGDVGRVEPATLPPGAWVVYAGNPDGYQDLDVLYAAMRGLRGARLLIVSAAPRDAFGDRLPPRCRVVRARDFRTVARFLAAATVAALPRGRCSGYPIKLLAYLAMGRATVATEGAVGPTPGVARVPSGDPAAFREALAALLDDPERRAALERAGRAHVRAACRWDAVAAAHDRVYRLVLGHDVQTDAARRYDASRHR